MRRDSSRNKLNGLDECVHKAREAEQSPNDNEKWTLAYETANRLLVDTNVLQGIAHFALGAQSLYRQEWFAALAAFTTVIVVVVFWVREQKK